VGDVEKNEKKTAIKKRRKKEKRLKQEPFAKLANLEDDLANENWKTDLSVYPLRKPSKDSKWSVRITWIWTGAALFSLTFIVVLLILGAIYD
jgi:hypothetical protein